MRSLYAPAEIEAPEARRVAAWLQDRLTALVDLGLSLKHAHWNVVGPGFIGVHELLDQQVATTRDLADEVAERIAAMGAVPNGLAGYIVDHRHSGEYAVGRAVVEAHLGALDVLYDDVISGHRHALAELDDTDIVTADLLTDQTRRLEQLQWLVRAHIENTSGALATTGEETQLDAAVAAATADPLE